MHLNKTKKIVMLVFLFITITLILLKPALIFTGWILNSDDSPVKDADYVVLLLGDGSPDRAEKVIELYNDKVAPKIILPYDATNNFHKFDLQMSTGNRHYEYLKRRNIPDEDIIRLSQCRNTSTFDEALCIKKYLKLTNSDRKKVILVTNWYHSGRSKWLFNQILSDVVDIYSIPAPLLKSKYQNWWLYEYSFLAVFSEYVKWTYWRVNFLIGRRHGDH
jgi:uncharacterized SAM-binding protein YcdF (DUF218 family)